MKSKRLSVLNGKLIAFYFMHFTIFIPLMEVINPTLIVASVSLIIVGLLVLYNGLRFAKIKLLVLYAFLICLFLLKIAFSNTSPIVLAYIIAFTAPPVFLFNFSFDYSSFLQAFITLSRISFFLIAWVPFSSGYRYMRFGYGMASVIIGVYMDFLYGRKFYSSQKQKVLVILDIAIVAIGSLEILLYGARGSLIVPVIFAFMINIFLNKKKVFRNLILSIVAIITIINAVPILGLLEKIAQYLGVRSYALTKYRMMLTEGFEYASSGRGILYSNAIDKIKKSPIFGNPIMLDDEGGEYVHNIFLQVGEDFGVFAIIVVLLFLLYVLYLLWSDNKTIIYEKLIILIFFSTSIGRLMFSSTIWRRPEFWLLVAFVLTYPAIRSQGNNTSLQNAAVSHKRGPESA